MTSFTDLEKSWQLNIIIQDIFWCIFFSYLSSFLWFDIFISRLCMMLFLEGLKLIWRKFLTSKWTRQCEFCFAWKSRMSTWLSFCFIRIKPLGRSFRLCSKYTSILKINGIFSVKVHSYEYIYHCMFLCGIRVCFLLIWHPNHQVEYIIKMYCWPNKWYNLKNPVLLLRIRLFSTECKTWKAKYIHS